MPRSKRFLILILILLLVNAAFFISWYGFGMKDRFREMLAMQLGTILKGKVVIGELKISDRQLLAEKLSYCTADSSLQVQVERLRVGYNLTRFLFSGFKLSRLIQDADIYRPIVRYDYRYKPSVPKPRKPLILPDFAGYFKSLRIREGAVYTGLSFPLKIVSQGDLYIAEDLQKINLEVVNKRVTTLSLSAESARGGLLKAQGTLNRGRIASLEVEVNRMHPKYIVHPDLKSIDSEITLVASLGQDSLGADLHYEAKAQLWATKGVFARDYPVSIPFLAVETDGKSLSAKISRSTVGSSYVSGEVDISDFGPKLRFNAAKAEAGLDLAMVNKDLLGFVNVDLRGGGSVKEPTATAQLSASQVSYKQYTLKEIALSAEYVEGMLNFELPGLLYQNQRIDLAGSFDPVKMAAEGKITTLPLQTEGQPCLVKADMDMQLSLPDKLPMLNLKIIELDLQAENASINGIRGELKLVPGLGGEKYLVDADLKSTDGFQLQVLGDVLSRDLVLDAQFNSLYPARLYRHPQLTKFDPELSGQIKAVMNNDRIDTHSRLELTLHDFLPFRSVLDAVGSYDLKQQEAALHLKTEAGELNEQPLQLSLAASLRDKQLNIMGLRINDLLSLSGRYNLQNYKDLDFSLALWNLNQRDIVRFYPQLDISIPDFEGLTLFADYNSRGDGLLDAELNLNQIDLLAVTPIGLNIAVSGPIDNLKINGQIDNEAQKILEMDGLLSLADKIELRLDANLDKLAIEKVLIDSPLRGTVSGRAGVEFRDLMNASQDFDISSDLRAQNLQIQDLTINTAILKAIQKPNLLQVDSLFVFSDRLFELSGSGAIDYNAVNNAFFDGINRLNLRVEGQLFPWLKNLTPLIQEAKGNSSLSCSVGVLEDQFLVSAGKLDISDGFLRIKDQTEPLTNIAVRGSFDKNRIIIERGQVQMGQGKLVFNNIFEADNSDHLMLGFLDLGILRLLIEEPGILANVPLFTPPKTLTNIVLKGKNSRYAMVKGPFDQMKISAEVILSNASALFPPNTDNLLKLANSVREATFKRSDSETAPLPFTLDVLITLGENVSYVTYPAKLSIEPGGFLHLMYDGLAFSVPEAFFSSERGTIDIFGTVFQVDKVDINMVESQDLLSVDGVFYKRAPDGTLVSLKAITLPDPTKSFMDRLQFSLTSDNPEDRTISQILARLRYSGSTDPNQQEQNGALQDEALSLISGNLDASLFTPILSPVETYVRRKLKLDNFSINAGFLQNLYTQYSNDPSQLANYTDMKQLSSDIAQFSSSILLDNLSISVSKYLGRRMFLDYQLELQEATDLQKRTRIMVSHETALRLMLPRQFRLGYTFQYTPQDKKSSHELMLQRSFRFWGL